MTLKNDQQYILAVDYVLHSAVLYRCLLDLHGGWVA
jgi:hypothetical protein